MIVQQATIDRIRGWRSKERVLRLPVNRKRLEDGSSARTKCPMKTGGTYTLTPRPEYARWVQQANELPTRARSVLWLIDRCSAPGRSVTITVLSAALDRPANEWAIVFLVGRHEVDDKPVFLAARGDYTTQRSRAAKGEPQVLMPLEEDLRKAREKALEDRFSPNVKAADGLDEAVGAFSKSMMRMKARNRLRLIEREAAKLKAEVAAEVSAAGGSISLSDCVECQAPARVDGESRPNDPAVVCLDTAA